MAGIAFKVDSEIPFINSVDWEKSVFHTALRVIEIVVIVNTLPLIIHILVLWISNGTAMYAGKFQPLVVFVRFGIGLYLALDGSHLVKFVFKEKAPSISPTAK